MQPLKRVVTEKPNPPEVAVPAAKVWDQICDVIDAMLPPEHVEAHLDAHCVRVAEALKSAVVAQGLPADQETKFVACIDEWLAMQRVELGCALYEELNSRRMARGIGRARIFGHGYATNGESNWLEHPEMRGLKLLLDCLKLPTPGVVGLNDGRSGHSGEHL